MQSAILPAEWARRTGLKAEQVANLAISSGRIWDARYMLEQGGGLSPSVDLVVVEVATWDFNQHLSNPVTGEEEQVPAHFRHWASFADRLGVDDLCTRVQLMAQWVWPLYQRRPFQGWLGARPVSVPLPPAPPLAHQDRGTRDRMAAAPAFRGENVAKMHLANARLSTFSQMNLDAFVADLLAGDRRVVLVQLPARDEYVNTIRADPSRALLYQQVQEIIRSRADGRRVSSVIWNLASDCGLPEDVFVDYGHFSHEGAAQFTDRLFDEISSPTSPGDVRQIPPSRPGSEAGM